MSCFFHLQEWHCPQDFGEFLPINLDGDNFRDSVRNNFMGILWNNLRDNSFIFVNILLTGMTLSSGFWGILADKFGRKPILIWASSFLCYFGILTAFAPSFHWVLFLRFIVGFFIGSVPQVSFLKCIRFENIKITYLSTQSFDLRKISNSPNS